MNIQQKLLNVKFIYFLGFLWADGNVSKKTNSIRIEIKKLDSIDIDSIINPFLNFKKYYRQRKKDGKNFGGEICSFNKCDKELKNFLVECNYINKSKSNQDKILYKIPPELKHYFWRGYFDGDGGLCIKNRNEISFWSTIEQDWKSLKDILEYLKIEHYTISTYTRKNGKHKSSCLSFRCAEEVKKFITYIYSGEQFGLARKINIKEQFFQKFDTLKLKKTSKYKSICYNKRNQKWKSSWYQNKKEYHFGWFNTEEEAYQKQQSEILKLPPKQIKNTTPKDYISK